MNGLGDAIKKLDNGWLQVKVPLPFSLKWVNAYLLPERSEDGNGWTLIDPGLRTEEIETFWTYALEELGIGWRDIRSIVLTHHHPDHYGMAGWFQRRTGAPVWMSRVAKENAARLWGEGETFSSELTQAFIRHGLAEELIGDMREHMSGFVAKVSPQPMDVRFLQVGDTHRMGGIEWDILGGEGHAPGHLLFYEGKGGKLLCGDQVLPRITPNIGWMPNGDPDPLGSFMDSLRLLLPVEVAMVYPGHRDPFPEYRERIGELLEHHERRLAKMAGMLKGGEKTAFEMCELLFGEKLRSNTHNLRFALAETIAHLEYMAKRGMALRIEGAADSEGKIASIRYQEADNIG
ncbi:MBL fold metallo-hydrolase [Cohnella endophytica]|uniref:MBL fold metallo-hydrolase n=1 Tax=Cohnella endophytica TaxID=2419778 RepID=A0A494XUF7_9BACL|nr:MBL fold metallo-hydrolase [Cohnella endophytica]RKP54198.1 MBL fold metallo-hydrolase [Cohnella endophytica]